MRQNGNNCRQHINHDKYPEINDYADCAEISQHSFIGLLTAILPLPTLQAVKSAQSERQRQRRTRPPSP